MKARSFVLLLCGGWLCCVINAEEEWPRISGGVVASVKDVPWQLGLFRSGNFECGAVLIDSKWALTAAHCVIDYAVNPDMFTLKAGHLFRDEVGHTGFEQEVKVEKIIVHVAFDNVTERNDIALLEIDGSIKLSNHAAPILISTRKDLLGATAVVSGWGSVTPDGNGTSPILREVTVPIVRDSICITQGRKPYDPKVNICAGGLGKDACEKDCGGPLTVDGELVGIVSHRTVPCGDYGVYVRVSYYREWIEAVLSGSRKVA